MSHAWRVMVTFDEPAPTERAARELSGREIEAQVRRRLHARVAVSVADPQLYLCTGTRNSAVTAEEVIRAVLAAHHLCATVVTHFWDPSIHGWINSADLVPDDTGLTLVLDQHRHGPASEIARDTRDADATGYATWQVRVKLPSHHDTVTFARRLKAQGHPPVRHWRHLNVGARNQDEAHALAAAIHVQAPPWAVISVLRVPEWLLPAALKSTAWLGRFELGSETVIANSWLAAPWPGSRAVSPTASAHASASMTSAGKRTLGCVAYQAGPICRASSEARHLSRA